MRVWIASLFLLGTGCAMTQPITKWWAPIEKEHHLKIIRESLSRPSDQFSLHLIPVENGYVLKGHRLSLHDTYFLATMDGITGAVDILYEFENLPDGTLKIKTAQGAPRYAATLPHIEHEKVLVGKPIDYVLVRKKDVTSAVATFFPYRLQTEGQHGESLFLTVTHPMLTRFALEAKGFEPGEAVLLTHRSGDKKETKTLTADAQGEIATPLNPTLLGKLGGQATLTLTGMKGSVQIEYPWGGQLENQTFKKYRAFPMVFVTRLPQTSETHSYALSLL
ncbi:MAG: hypothetical protein HY069_03025 [Chlamydiia bacterium]|nr:hypothetical protein [Chlamydiia bacterium]